MKALDMDKVVALFSLFTDLTGAPLEHWRGFCQQSAGDIQRRLREDVDPAAHMEELCSAAAACAYCSYLLVDTGSRLEDEVKVGDISLKSSAANRDQDSALQIRDHFLSAVAHLLRPECPALIAVEEPK